MITAEQLEQIAAIDLNIKTGLDAIRRLPHDDFQGRVTVAASLVALEMVRSHIKHGRHNSAHESWGVLEEELSEAMDELRANDGHALQAELLQVAAVALRGITDLKVSP